MMHFDSFIIKLLKGIFDNFIFPADKLLFNYVSVSMQQMGIETYFFISSKTSNNLSYL